MYRQQDPRKMQQLLDMYRTTATAVIQNDTVTGPQKVQLLQYWNEANMYMTEFQMKGNLPSCTQNRLLGSLEDIHTLLTPVTPQEEEQPPNVLALSLSGDAGESGWLGFCKSDKESVVALFEEFNVPLPPNLDQLSSQELCLKLATSWPHDCMNGWKPKKVLGSGFEGVVYSVCQMKKCEAVAKMQLLQPEVPIFTPQQEKLYPEKVAYIRSLVLTPVHREYFIQKAVGPPTAPETLDFFVCNTFAAKTGKRWGVIVMEQFDGTLRQLISQVSPFELHKLLGHITKMVMSLSTKGVTHRDLNTDNILYKRVGPNIRLSIADYGFAYMKDLTFWNRDVSTMKRYLPTKVNPYYDLAYLLMHLRRDTGNMALQLPELTDNQVQLVTQEMQRIKESLM